MIITVAAVCWIVELYYFTHRGVALPTLTEIKQGGQNDQLTAGLFEL